MVTPKQPASEWTTEDVIREDEALAGDEDWMMTPEETWAMFDRMARRYAGMSGEEFVRAWDAGEIENPDRPGIIDVAFMLPVAKQFHA